MQEIMQPIYRVSKDPLTKLNIDLARAFAKEQK
jgi:hypothetical protein